MSQYWAATTGFPHTAPPPDKAIYGGKGAGLIEMAQAQLPVPRALVITTLAWQYYKTHNKLPDELIDRVAWFVSDDKDCMFSVRSGAPVSMPGMMDTVLNVGVTVELDDMYPGAFHRFATSWLEIVKGVPKARVKTLSEMIEARADSSERRFSLMAGVIKSAEGLDIPLARTEQVLACIEAVFRSWDTPRARAYRKMHDIPEDMGTACVVQKMVMGTAKGLSGSGVMFTRNPATGENEMKGEIAFNAQGEEVVSGEITPMSLDDLAHSGNPYWENLHSQLGSLCSTLEAHFGDVQDIEFTVEDGTLYVLQTRTAKMSARARIETAVALCASMPSPQRYSYLKARLTRRMVEQTRIAVVDTDMKPTMTGLPAAPGAISGRIVFRTTPIAKIGKDCILVAEDTSPDDFPIMAKCGGILTKTGGFTCHSAVVARGIGVPAVVGAGDLTFTKQGWVTIGSTQIQEESYITLDGTLGQVFTGEHPVKKQQPPRSIYEALHYIVKSKGIEVASEVYYYDCGIGYDVVLPLNPADLDQVETQLKRMEKMKEKGKNVVLAFEMQGMGEDLFSDTAETLFQGIADNFAGDIAGTTIAYGVSHAMAPKVTEMLGVSVNLKNEISILDLLDLLGG